MKLPSVMGLVLCDEVGRDPETGKPSIRGVFNAWHSSEFPTATRPFAVYVALYDGVGEGTLELSVMRLETEEVIYVHRQWLVFSQRMTPLIVGIEAKKCRFPAPGRYALDLRFDGRLLTQQYLDVFAA